MNINRQLFHDGIDAIADAAKHGVTWLHSNQSINSVGKHMLSPVAVAGDMIRNKEILNPLNQMYLKDAAGKSSVQLEHIAGSAFTAGVGAGVLGGLTHDSAGNPDIAGIPMI